LSENKTLEQAISRLGLTETKNVVAIISNRSLFKAKEGLHSDRLKMTWEHSLCCGYASELIAKASGIKNHEGELFTLGLLHDIGKLLLLQIAAELQVEGVLSSKHVDASFYRSLFAHHGKFGAALFKKWSFPKEYMDISVYHDNLSDASNITKELLVIHLANHLAKSIGYSDDGDAETSLEDCESLKLLRLDDETVRGVSDRLSSMMREIDFK
jgi:HD-like signal output (HDOD) protein